MDLGCYYEFGAKEKSGRVLATPNLVTAMKWYQAAAEQGNPGAQNALSRILSTAGEIECNFPLAIQWAKKAIAQGDSCAAFNLATIYRDLSKPKLAFHWYQHAGSMGDTDAFLQLGLCYFFGFGTKQDFDAARSAFEQVTNAATGSTFPRSKVDAYYWISVLCLVKGGQTKKSVAQIRSMLEIANADDDHEPANELLNLIGKKSNLLVSDERA